jgi:hypothetical protein
LVGLQDVAVARPAKTWTWVHAASLAAVFVVLVLACRGQWFFGDEWDFILFRGLHHPARGLLRPHNEHWSTLPILWYRALFSIVGLKSYWPYLASLFALHLAAVHALWRIARRVGVSPLLATAGAGVFALFGWGSENLLWAFQIGFVSSLAAGLFLMLALDDRGSWRRVAAVAIGAIVSLLLSGISVVMVVALGIGALGRWGWRKAAAVTAPAAVTYLLWLQGPGGAGLDQRSVNSHGWRDLGPYLWGGFRATFGEPLHSRTAGGVVALLLATVFVARLRWTWRRAPEVVALATAAILMYAVISQGRGAIQPPDVSRYRYLAIALVLPFILLSVSALAVRSRLVEVTAVVCAAALIAGGIVELRTNARTDSRVKLDLRSQLLASIDVAESEPTLTDKPDFMFGSGVDVAQLRRLRADGKLPAWNHSARSAAAARLGLEVDLVSTSAHASSASRTDCVIGEPETPAVEVGPRAGRWTLDLLADRTSRVQLFVSYVGGEVGPRFVEVGAGGSARIRAVLRTPLIVRVASGAVRVCGPEARRQ